MELSINIPTTENGLNQNDFNALIAVYGTAYVYEQSVGNSILASNLIASFEALFLKQISLEHLAQIKIELNQQIEAIAQNKSIQDLKLNLG